MQEIAAIRAPPSRNSVFLDPETCYGQTRIAGCPEFFETGTRRHEVAEEACPMMVEERAYWTEDQIGEVLARFRAGIAAGSNSSAVTDTEAAALVVSGIGLTPAELGSLCQQSGAPARCGFSTGVISTPAP